MSKSDDKSKRSNVFCVDLDLSVENFFKKLKIRKHSRPSVSLSLRLKIRMSIYEIAFVF